jgi:hypothetical protein
MSPLSSSDSRPPSRRRESDIVSFVMRWTLTKESRSISRRDGNRAYLSGVTVGRGFFVSFITLGSGVDATGVVGTDISSERRALPPRASKSSACFVFLVPSFIPDPLNVGARSEEGTGDTVLAGGEPSNRCETGA